jgi:hypothetical protein
MKLNEIQEMWVTDSRIDETNLGSESTKIPKLHAKYLNLLVNSKLSARKAESEYLRMRRLKWRYYRGEMTQLELDELNWPQWQGVKPLKNEMDEFIATDTDLITLQDRMEYHRTVLAMLENILKSIHSRTWDIKNGIEWTKFTNGMI